MSEEQQERPAYYSILTAKIRYSKLVCANAKLLFSEITALCNKEGYCYATNAYFAKLYEVDPDTISKWISQLKDAGFIAVEITDRIYRKIYLTDEKVVEAPTKKGIGSTESSGEDRSKERHNIKENIKTNSTSNREPSGSEQPTKKFKTFHEFAKHSLSQSTFNDLTKHKTPDSLPALLARYWQQFQVSHPGAPYK